MRRATNESLLSKKHSKKELPKMPLFLGRVKSLVCTGEMIGSSRSGAGGMRSRASGAACLYASFWCFSIRALALSELRLFPVGNHLSHLRTFLGRAAPDRAGARPLSVRNVL